MSSRLLNQQSTKTVTTRGRLAGGASINYGLGVFVRKTNGRDAIRHGGGISGYRSEVVHYPASGYTFAVLSNCDHANTARIADRLANRIIGPPKE